MRPGASASLGQGSSSVFDSLLFRDAFATPHMRAVFNDLAFIQRCVEVEVALARAQARVGVIPEDAAATIASRADTAAFDLDALRIETANVGFPIVAIVRQLSMQCGEAGRYVHWGATTQDIMDTAAILQIRAALALVDADVTGLQTTLATLATRHRDLPMAGRTHMQHALPITFGYKAAVWLSGLQRNAARLSDVRPRLLVGSLGGAVGTLASLGPDAIAVEAAFCEELALGVPAAPWHVMRDSMAEVTAVLALLTGTLEKVAGDIAHMASTEVGEVAEPHVPGRGGSSTMPQKRNPISCELIIAAARGVRSSAGLMMDAMAHDFERATGPWQAEWIALPQAFLLTSGALHQARLLLDGLHVDGARMARNLELTHGMIVAEAVMMGLAPALGRLRAHDVVHHACDAARASGASLAECLAADPEVAALFDRAALARLTDPASYLGLSGAIVDRVTGRNAADPS
jgi:3-carboxy-cis,cis-muconate cycloisomerase